MSRAQIFRFPTQKPIPSNPLANPYFTLHTVLDNEWDDMDAKWELERAIAVREFERT